MLGLRWRMAALFVDNCVIGAVGWHLVLCLVELFCCVSCLHTAVRLLLVDCGLTGVV